MTSYDPASLRYFKFALTSFIKSRLLKTSPCEIRYLSSLTACLASSHSESDEDEVSSA